MKNLKFIFSLFLITCLMGCSGDENGTGYLDDVEAPSNISALFTITHDNSGKVTIRPNGVGVASYEIYFGDATTEPETIGSGQTVDHIYAEGTYTVKIIAIAINGLRTEYTQELTVTFVAPENLEVAIAAQPGNAYVISVSAKASYETYFDVTYGDDPDAAPVAFNEGQTVSHTYTAVGTYEVKVTAYSGGAATSVYTQNYTVFDPLLLPVTFESPTLNYAFGDFGGVFSGVANNPSVSGINTSAKVGKMTKTPGAEVWAGTSMPLDNPIDFSVMKKISIKVYSPKVGAIVKFKMENLNDANINTEKDAVTTVANQWETLTYDFTGINNANNYQRIVIFYDFNVSGTGAEFYFDDVMQTNGTPQLSLPLTFQSTELTYTFSGFGGANAVVVDNPHQTGLNTSTKVGQLTKNAGSETWAGAFITLPQAIDFSSLHKIKMMVWSTQPGTIILMKLEASSTVTTELQAVTTVTNGWEELTYDFNGIVNSNGYKTITLFFDFNSAGTGLNYYFDDIKLSN